MYIFDSATTRLKTDSDQIAVASAMSRAYQESIWLGEMSFI